MSTSTVPPPELQPFYATFNGYFFLTLTGLLIGFFTIIVKSCYQSRCSHCNLCCGLCKIDRDTNIDFIPLQSRNSSLV
jgi:hypothetical protein